MDLADIFLILLMLHSYYLIHETLNFFDNYNNLIKSLVKYKIFCQFTFIFLPKNNENKKTMKALSFMVFICYCYKRQNK